MTQLSLSLSHSVRMRTGVMPFDSVLHRNSPRSSIDVTAFSYFNHAKTFIDLNHFYLLWRRQVSLAWEQERGRNLACYENQARTNTEHETKLDVSSSPRKFISVYHLLFRRWFRSYIWIFFMSIFTLTTCTLFLHSWIGQCHGNLA